MKKDKIASVALILLVACSVILTVKIWVSEELWPDGRNFFINKEKFISCLPFINEEKLEPAAVAPLHETVFKPSSIAVSVPGTGSSIYSGGDDKSFSELNALSKKVLSVLFKNEESGTEVSLGEYYDTLKSRSVMVKYPVSLPAKVVGHMCEVNSSPVFSDVSSIKDFSVIPDSASDDAVLVYMHDSVKKAVLKYRVSGCRNDFDEAVSAYSKGGNKFVSAYELGFYKSDIGVEQRVVFDPLVFIDTSSERPETAVIAGKSPFDRSEPSELGIDSINSFISAFGYNPNSVRRYTDKDGTLVFVENYSTIKLDKNGILEYTTTTPEKGINMQIHSEIPDNPQNVLDAVDSVSEILGNVWAALAAGELPDVRLSSPVTDNYSDYKLNFDFRYNGFPIIINSGDIKHAVELEVKNNRLVSLKAYVRSYGGTGDFAENTTPLEALDSFFEELPGDSEAADLFLGYIDYGTNGKINTHWNISSENGEISSLRR